MPPLPQGEGWGEGEPRRPPTKKTSPRERSLVQMVGAWVGLPLSSLERPSARRNWHLCRAPRARPVAGHQGAGPSATLDKSHDIQLFTAKMLPNRRPRCQGYRQASADWPPAYATCKSPPTVASSPSSSVGTMPSPCRYTATPRFIYQIQIGTNVAIAT